MRVQSHHAHETLIRLFFFCLCFTFIGNSQAQQSGQHRNWSWDKFTDGGAASTNSTKYGSAIQWQVAFDARDECNPVIFYRQSADTLKERLKEGPLSIELRVRIDRRAPWQVNSGEATGFYVKDTDGRVTSYYIGLPVNTKFVVDILEGYTLRVLRVDNGFTDRFSLRGSAVALRKAYALCSALNQKPADPDLRYFDVQPPSPEVRPKSQDPDRAYFN